MTGSYLTAVIAIVLLVTGWVAVQAAWRQSFPEAAIDPDALACRGGCHGCDDSEACGGKTGACKEGSR